jgi:poly(3-hydroxyalkanoate) synthetase
MADHLNEEEHKVSITDILSNNMLTEVLTKVASSSFTDLFKAKLTCRDLYWLAEEDHIFQQASLENIPHSWCTNAEVMFLKRYKKSRNPDAIFREDMLGYFTSRILNLGLSY